LKKLKACILIVGRLDSFEYCYYSLKKYIIDPLGADIFFSGHPNKLGLEYCDEKINTLWKPKKYILRKYDKKVRKEAHPKDSRFKRKRKESTPHTWLSGMHNVRLANQLKLEYEEENSFKYDICIKARTDVVWHSYIDKSDTSLVLEDPDNILIPTAWDFKAVHPLGCSDVSCVTSSEGMNKYAAFMDYVDQYYDRGEVFHPESMLGIHLNHIGLNRIPIEKGVDPFTNQENQSGWCVVDPNRERQY
jgi:hypothetical protein